MSKTTQKERKDEVIELDENTFLLKAHGGECTLTVNDKELEVPLGVIAEIMDMRDIDSKYDDDVYPFIIEFSITSLKFHVDYIKDAIGDDDIYEEIKDKKDALVMDAYRYGGGVPFNIEHIKGVKEDFKDIHSEVRKIKNHLYKEPVEARYFKDYDSCIKFIKVIAHQRIIPVLRMCGFWLDRPINLVGHTGWSVIESQRLNKDKFKI